MLNMNQSDSTYMESPQTQTQSSPMDLFNGKNMTIVILLALLLLSFLGINILALFGNLIQSITNIFGPLISQILSFFGYTTGSILNKTADIVGDTAKTGIDIAEGTVHSVGDLLKNASTNVDINSKRGLDIAINSAGTKLNEPKPDNTDNPIQKPITASKSQWCLVGEYKGKRGCIEVGDQDKCISGQIFPNQHMCLNPTKTP